MCEVEEMDMPPLHAAEYRRLWLDEAHRSGLVAETLAEALGWQPTADELIPDPLALAEAAAARLAQTPRRRRHCAETGQTRAFALN